MRATLEVNGERREVDCGASQSLLSVLREALGLTGAKYACGEGQCGACTVLVAGQPVHACVTTIASVGTQPVTTIEGLERGGRLHPLQQALLDERAFQCGYCTPGMIMAGVALLAATAAPSRDDIARAMEGNLCRCCAYSRIVSAIQRAAQRGDRPGDVCSVPAPETAETRKPRALELRDERGGTRTEFVSASEGALLVALAIRDPFAGLGWTAPGTDATTAEQIGAWLEIAAGGAVTVYTGKVDLGQGIRTSLTQTVAEELRVPPSAVRLVMGDTELTPYDMGTFGSMTTPQMGLRLRQLAAGARALLIRPAGDRRGAEVVRGDVELTPADAWQVAGHSEPPVGGEAIVRGRRCYTSDMRLPGMLHGKVLRPPAIGATLESVDMGAARALAGVVVAQESGFAGVAAASRAEAERALAAVRAVWTPGPDAPSSAELFDYLRRTRPRDDAESEGWPGSTEPFVVGDADAALAIADHRLTRTYTAAYIAHVPLEPRAAIAQWSRDAAGDKLTVWTGTQRPFGVQEELSVAFGLPASRVRVIVPDTGSGYGGKHTGEAAVEAARLARAAGRPVKLLWTREEEFRWGYLRPAAVIDVDAGVRADGTITAWRFDDYNAGAAAIRPWYAIANQRVVFHPSDSPLRQGAYRALAATVNQFARETHVDELAQTVGIDPLAFRLKNLTDPRLQAVLTAAADRFGWGAPLGPERGVGLACGCEKGGYVATCAEVRVEPSRRAVQVVRLVTAFDCGAIVNPDGLRNQIEGATVQALGGALFEAVEFDHGLIRNASLAAYRVPRFSDLPAVEIVLVDRKDRPSAGAGETPLVAVAPAVGAAIFQATGTRPRALPMERDACGRSASAG